MIDSSRCGKCSPQRVRGLAQTKLAPAVNGEQYSDCVYYAAMLSIGSILMSVVFWAIDLATKEKAFGIAAGVCLFVGLLALICWVEQATNEQKRPKLRIPVSPRTQPMGRALQRSATFPITRFPPRRRSHKGKK